MISKFLLQHDPSAFAYTQVITHKRVFQSQKLRCVYLFSAPTSLIGAVLEYFFQSNLLFDLMVYIKNVTFWHSSSKCHPQDKFLKSMFLSPNIDLHYLLYNLQLDCNNLTSQSCQIWQHGGIIFSQKYPNSAKFDYFLPFSVGNFILLKDEKMNSLDAPRPPVYAKISFILCWFEFQYQICTHSKGRYPVKHAWFIYVLYIVAWISAHFFAVLLLPSFRRTFIERWIIHFSQIN